MKYLILLLLPLSVYSQSYRLDSIRYISPTETMTDKFVYSDDRNFLILRTVTNSNVYWNYNSVSNYVDSLLVREVIFQHGDSVEYIFEYDDLRRQTANWIIRDDTIRQSNLLTYHDNTTLLLSEERTTYKNGDTSHYYLETNTYDAHLRIISSSYYVERADTFYRTGHSHTSFLGDTVSYSQYLYLEPHEAWDTSYSQSIYLPNKYFGDTLRQWTITYAITKDTMILSTDELVQFTWGDFKKYEDAGDWVYLHGILYGSNIDYEPTSFGYSFIAYESLRVNANPENWQSDILTWRDEIYTGTLRVNQDGLPVEQLVRFANNVVYSTSWYYSIQTSIEELNIDKPMASECKIISQLDPNARYFNMSGSEVNFLNVSQLLLEVHREGVRRVLFMPQSSY